MFVDSKPVMRAELHARELELLKYRSASSKITKGSDDPKIFYLLDAFSLVNELTNPWEEEALPAPQYYSLEDTDIYLRAQSNPDEDIEVLQSKNSVSFIASIGHVLSNAPFIRVVNRDFKALNEITKVEEVTRHELHFVCRPFMLDALEDMSKLDIFKSVFSYAYSSILARGTCAMNAKSKTVDNMLCILKHIGDDTLVTPFPDSPSPFRCHRGMINLLNEVFNDTSNWYYHDTRFKPTETPHVFDKICDLITQWTTIHAKYSSKPSVVVFSGFSLGAMMTTVLAPCIHANFVQKRMQPPTIECRTLCGMKMGDQALATYVSQYTPCMNCVSLYDPVSCLPASDEYSHVFPIITVRVHESNARYLAEKDNKYFSYLHDAVNIYFRQNDILRALLNSKVDSLITMAINYLRGKSDNFKRYHLSAEDVIPRLLMNYSIEILKEAPSLYFTFTEQTPKLLCQYFSTDKYAMKYGICPPSKCQFDKEDETSMKWVCSAK